MKNCPRCHTEMEDDALFCGECGAACTPAQAEETVNAFCTECGQPLETGIAFCPNCGAAAEGDAPISTPKKKKGKLIFLLAGLFTLVIAAVVAVLLLFGGNKTNYVAYIKDGELWYHQFGGDFLEITSDFVTVDDVADEDMTQLNGQKTSIMFQLAADGKTLFYPDKIDENGMNLYYRDISDPEAEPVKLGSSIMLFFINDKGDRILFQKDSGIYLGPIDNVRKICGEDCGLVAVDAKFEKAIYCESEKIETEERIVYDYTFYLWEDGKKEKIASGEIHDLRVIGKAADCRTNQIIKDYYGSSRVLVYESLNEVCYLKEDVLNIRNSKGDVEKIDSEVDSIQAVLENGDIYYTQKGKEIRYADFIDLDNGIQLTDSEKERTYCQAYTLFGYIDGKTVRITENYYLHTSVFTDSGVALIRYYDFDSVKKVKMSEVQGFSDATQEIRDRVEMPDAVLVDGIMYEIELDNIHSFSMTEDGTSIFFLTKEEEKEESADSKKPEKGELYSVCVKDGKVEAPKLYDSEVSVDCGFTLNKNGDPIYYKDYKEEKKRATLVIAGEELDNDVFPGWIRYMENGGYVYFIDYNADETKQNGTLRMYRKDQAQTIADDVYTVVVTPDNEILYLKEYDLEDCKGVLYRYHDGKNEQLDEDVTALLDIYVRQ